MEAGACKHLVKLLSAAKIEVQLYALTAVANLALQDDGQEKLREEGAVTAVVLHASSPNSGMQCHAARALANLAFCCESNEVGIVKAGGIPPLLKLIDAPELHTAQEAIAALANLARNPSNQRQMVECGALVPLCAAMRAARCDPELLRQGARCIANVSSPVRVCVCA